MKVKLLLTESTTMRIEARIVGVTKIGKVKRRFYQSRMSSGIVLLAMVILMTFFDASTIKLIALGLLFILFLVSDFLADRRTDTSPKNWTKEMLVFPAFDISELDQEKFPLVPISHTRYLHHEERALVRNFKMTCYYVARIFGPHSCPHSSVRNRRSKRDKRTMRN